MNAHGASEISEQEVCTPLPTASNTARQLPPRPRTRKNRSTAWDHFTKEPGDVTKAKCYYCDTLIRCDNGTSAMKAHWRRCQDIPTEGANKRQKSGSSSTENMEGSSSIISKIDQVELRKALVKMFIGLELPFRKLISL
ncbi:cellulase [Trifolium repens]|nr:cellulase [Trifolium repens]